MTQHIHEGAARYQPGHHGNNSPVPSATQALANPQQLLTEHIDLWTSAVRHKSTAGRGSNRKLELAGINKLRELILELAVRGKLVPQNPDDEPASELLKRIETEKAQLIKDGKLKKQKPLPPVSDDEKPFELPEGWEWVRFGDATFNRDAERIPLSVDERQHRRGEFDYYGASGVIDNIDDYLFEKPLLLIGEDGANLTNRSTPIAFMARGKYWVNNHAHVIDGISEQFLIYICMYINSISLVPYVTGTAQPKMNQAKMNTIVLAIPPQAEQHRIVAKVDELMALCDQLEQQSEHQLDAHQLLTETLLFALLNPAAGALTNATSAQELSDNWQRLAQHFDLLFSGPMGAWAIDRLKDTILQLAVMGKLVPQNPDDEPAAELLKRIDAEKARLVKEGKIKKQKPLPPVSDDEKPFELPEGWEWVRFDNLIHPESVISYGVLVPGPDVDDGVPFVRIEDLSLNCPSDLPNKSISREVDSQYERTRLHGGEILMGVVGSIGKLGLAPSSWKGANIARAVCRIDPSSLISKEYIITILQSQFMQNSFAGDTRTLAQPTLNIGLIRTTVTPLPPLTEQQHIVAKVDELFALCDQLKERLQQASDTQLNLTDAIVEQALN